MPSLLLAFPVSQTTEAGTVGQAFLTTRDAICLLRNSPLQMEQHRGRILAIASPLPGLIGMWESRGAENEKRLAEQTGGRDIENFDFIILSWLPGPSPLLWLLHSVKTKTPGLREVK